MKYVWCLYIYYWLFAGNKANVNSKEAQLFDSSLNTLMGLTLVFGFILMLLIDQLSSKYNRGKFINIAKFY